MRFSLGGLLRVLPHMRRYGIAQVASLTDYSQDNDQSKSAKDEAVSRLGKR